MAIRTELMQPLYAGKPVEYGEETFILSRKDAQFIENQLENLLKKIEEFTSKALKDPSTLALLGLPKDLNGAPSPLGLHIPFARFDCLFDGKDLHVLELNTDGTSGWNIAEWLGEKVALKPDENPNLWLSQRLLDGLRLHRPSAQEICLVDFHEVNTKWEQEDLVERWNRSTSPVGVTSSGGVTVNLAGPIRCARVNPQFRGWKDGALMYRRALSWELRAKPGDARSFLSDWADGKITVVGGWSSDVGMSKVWPAFLKPSLCPETVLISDKNIKQVGDEKEGWVVKGALSYSGRGVFSGHELKEDAWRSCLERALAETKSGRPWILQRRVEVPLWNGKPVELGVYFINGRPAGYLCRAGAGGFISEVSSEKVYPVAVR